MPDPVLNHIATSNSTPRSQHDAIVTTLYVKLDDATDGWLKVALEDGSYAFLCEYTKVTMVKTAGGRTFFRIADGCSESVGKVASLRDDNAARYLTNKGPTVSTETVQVKYGELAEEISRFKGRLLQQWAHLTIQGKQITVTLNSVWGTQYAPIPPGVHRIMAPDTSHANISTNGYRNAFPGKIKGNNAWFPIELAGTVGNSSRYVHIGHLSEGCVTVHEIEHWNLVYEFLIAHRMPHTNGKYVALLEVTR
jgi:hypothetical protein